jgi:hypothetical protein
VSCFKDLDLSLEGADVLIVEDIVDSGVTLNYLMHLMEQRRPKSLRIATLLDKPERRQRPVAVSYVGFRIPDKFVVGYGLDFDEKYRNLDDICILEEAGKRRRCSGADAAMGPRSADRGNSVSPGCCAAVKPSFNGAAISCASVDGRERKTANC